MDEMQNMMNVTKEEVDVKLVKIRKDFDINLLKKSIEKKANSKEMQLTLE